MKREEVLDRIRIIVVLVVVLTCLWGMLSQLFEWKWLADWVTYAFTAGVVGVLLWSLSLLGFPRNK